MRAVIQRVSEASVTVDAKVVAEISGGLLLLIGIEDADTFEDADWLASKVTKLRIFSDEDGLMNKSLEECDGDVIVVSQFTLFAATKKGNRPSYIRAAKPDIAIPMYNYFISKLEGLLNKKIQSGIFGADMKVSLLNDGPVTILIDTKDKE